MEEKKVKKLYIDFGFGFPVHIINAPFIKIRGQWALDINYNKYAKNVLMALASKPVRLTGNEVNFIRHYFEMDLKSFGKRFGDVAHSAVIKWEKFGDKPTNMNWSTEKDIRLSIINKFNPSSLKNLYLILEKTAPRKSHSLSIDAVKLKAA